jgi:hypothetical protein
MIHDLQDYFGERTTCALLGVPVLTFRDWLAGRGMTASGVRVVWLSWCLTFHPERLQTVEDLVTWGRFHVERGEPARGVGDWSI